MPTFAIQRLHVPSVMHLLTVLLAACIWLFISNGRAQAQTLTEPTVAGLGVPIEQTTDFRSQPLGILAKFPEAGTAMARFVAKLVTRDPGVVDSLMSTMSASSPEQASAMGAGLVRAARALEAKQSRMARTIAAKVMRSTNQWLKSTFLAIGPAYAANAPLIVPDPLPPSPRSNTLVGTALPDEKSVLGPERNTQLVPLDSNSLLREAVNRSDVIGQDGTIIALIADGPLVNVIASTPPNNGALPTTPN